MQVDFHVVIKKTYRGFCVCQENLYMSLSIQKNTCLIHPGSGVSYCIANITQHFSLHLPRQRHSSQGRVPGGPVGIYWEFPPTLDPRNI